MRKEPFVHTILFIILILSVSITHAQIKKPGFTFGGSLIYSIPRGNFDNAYNRGLGAEAYAGIGVGNTFIIGTLGIATYGAEKENNAGRLTYTPVKVGLKQFFLAKRLFVNADLGLARVKNKLTDSKQFTRGIGAGVRLLGLEAGLYYDGFKNKNQSGFSNSLNAKVGWSFSL